MVGAHVNESELVKNDMLSNYSNFCADIQPEIHKE